MKTFGARIYRRKRFDKVGTSIRIEPEGMRMPSEAIAAGRVYNTNNLYRDYRGTSWHRAERALQLETAVLTRLDRINVPEEYARLIARFDRFAQLTDGLDLGTASTVFSLAAAGAIPLTSCNGGAFGGRHREPCPVVAFWWPSREAGPLKALQECAIEAKTAVWTVPRLGVLTVEAMFIDRLTAFARCLQRRRHELQLPSKS